MNIVVCGNYGAKNLGDEMILQGLLTALKDFSPDAEITVFSGDPKETQEKYKVNAVKKFPAGLRSFFKILSGEFGATRKALKECDYFFLGGGGLFGGPEERGNLIWAMQALAAMLYRKPIIMYGQSVGEIPKRYRWLVKKIFKKAVFIAVRDEASKINLKNLGITKAIHLMPDLAFRVGNFNLKSESRTILLALRESKKISPTFKSEIAKFLDFLIAQGYDIKAFDFQTGKHGDHHLHEEIKNLLDDKSKFDFAENLLEAGFCFVLGMRLHSVISAIKFKTPFIAISYDSKVKNLLKTISLEEFLFEMDKINCDKLKNKFAEINKNQNQIVAKLKDFNQKALSKHIEVEEKLKIVLQGLARTR